VYSLFVLCRSHYFIYKTNGNQSPTNDCQSYNNNWKMTPTLWWCTSSLDCRIMREFKLLKGCHVILKEQPVHSINCPRRNDLCSFLCLIYCPHIIGGYSHKTGAAICSQTFSGLLADSLLTNPRFQNFTGRQPLHEGICRTKYSENFSFYKYPR